MFDKYTPEEIQSLLNESNSMRDFLSKLGYDKTSGGNRYRMVKHYVESNNLDLSKIHESRYKTHGKKSAKKRDLSEYLNNKYPISSYKLKNRLLKENILKPICSKCTNIEWCGEPIPLQLDHIDGNPHNNNLTNLRLLCPNCHSQTDTYCGKNIKNYNNSNNSSEPRKKKETVIKEKRIRPKKCNLTDNEIYELFLSNNKNFSKTGKQLGISDNAVRKRIKNLQGL